MGSDQPEMTHDSFNHQRYLELARWRSQHRSHYDPELFPPEDEEELEDDGDEDGDEDVIVEEDAPVVNAPAPASASRYFNLATRRADRYWLSRRLRRFGRRLLGRTEED